MRKLVFIILALLPILLIGELLVQSRYFMDASASYDEIVAQQKHSPEIGSLHDNYTDAYLFQLRTFLPTAFLLVMLALLWLARHYKKPIFYVPLAFPVLLWVLTATLGVSQVKRRVFDEYTRSLSKEWTDEYPISEWKDRVKNPDAGNPTYQLHSWSPSPFVVITDCDFSFGATNAISFQTVHFWWGDWERIMRKVTGIS